MNVTSAISFDFIECGSSICGTCLLSCLLTVTTAAADVRTAPSPTNKQKELDSDPRPLHEHPRPSPGTFLPPVSLPIFQRIFETRHAARPQRTKPIGE